MGSSRADITYKKYHQISEYSGYFTYDTLSQTLSTERHDRQEPSLKRREPGKNFSGLCFVIPHHQL